MPSQARHREPGSGSSERLFVALRLAPEVAGPLRQRVEQACGESSDLRLVEPELLHLTLAFLGQVERSARRALESDLAVQLEDHVAPQLLLTGQGCFRARGRTSAIWVGVQDEGGQDLERLFETVTACVRRAGLERDRRPPRPHVTIARPRRSLRDPARSQAVDRATPDGLGSLAMRLAWRPRAVCLVRSEPSPSGSVYTTAARWTLACRP